MPGNHKNNISFGDPGGEIRAEIKELIADTPGASVSGFVRAATEDRIFEMRQAAARVEEERSNRIQMSGEISTRAIDDFVSERALQKLGQATQG